MTGSKKGHAVEAARKLFDENGFHNTGIDAVVTGAAVARMTLYKHFRSKDGLVQSTVIHHTDRFTAYLEEGMRSGSDAVEGIANAFVSWWHGQSPFGSYRGCYLTKALAEFSGISETIESAARSGIEQYRELCRRAARESGIADADGFGDALFILVAGMSDVAMGIDPAQLEGTFRQSVAVMRRAYANDAAA
ncbi:MAG: TetR/AcrR family transcriptional regulator [Myxococcota bacterium]